MNLYDVVDQGVSESPVQLDGIISKDVLQT